VARLVFALSVCATLFWVFGFVAERLTGEEPPLWLYMGPALLSTGLLCLSAFRLWPRFLLPPSSARSFPWLPFGAWTVIAYVLGVVFVGLVSFVYFSSRVPQSSEALRSETSMLAVLLALWFPLWFAPAVGLVLAWWRQCRAESRSNPTLNADARQADSARSPRTG
jgi:hypothetical protein